MRSGVPARSPLHSPMPVRARAPHRHRDRLGLERPVHVGRIVLVGIPVGIDPVVDAHIDAASLDLVDSPLQLGAPLVGIGSRVGHIVVHGHLPREDTFHDLAPVGRLALYLSANLGLLHVTGDRHGHRADIVRNGKNRLHLGISDVVRLVRFGQRGEPAVARPPTLIGGAELEDQEPRDGVQLFGFLGDIDAIHKRAAVIETDSRRQTSAAERSCSSSRGSWCCSYQHPTSRPGTYQPSRWRDLRVLRCG